MSLFRGVGLDASGLHPETGAEVGVRPVRGVGAEVFLQGARRDDGALRGLAGVRWRW